MYFNPRPPRGGRRGDRAEVLADFEFQSTPSAGRATMSTKDAYKEICISIHALRGEGDVKHFTEKCAKSYFNPRPPRGGRPYSIPFPADCIYFNPRPPRGGRQQKCTNFIYGFFMIYKLSRKPTHFIPIIKYFFAHFFKKHDAFPVRKPAGFDVSMNFALKH